MCIRWRLPLVSNPHRAGAPAGSRPHASPLREEEHVREALRRNVSTVVVAAVTAMVFGGAGAAFAIVANADRVDGYHANQLIRIASSSINDDAAIGADANALIRKVSIKAPARGYLFMVASSDVYGGSGYSDCWLNLDGKDLNSSERSIHLDGGGNDEENCGTDIAWPVGKGSHVVKFRAYINSGLTYDESTLEVVFIPFNGSGKVPSPKPPTRPIVGGGRGN
jgi:hypothetical protein